MGYMLTLIPYSEVEEKEKLLKGFNPENCIWITSDIKSKWFILEYLSLLSLDKKPKNVLRAREFWIKCLKESRDIQFLPRDFLLLIYQKWALSQNLPEWQSKKETGTLICNYMEALAHLLKHPQRDPLLEEWLKPSNRENIYWMKWYKLAKGFWDYLSQKNIIESSWSAVFLLDEFPYKTVDSKELIFDLNLDISNVEVELISQISKKINTKVLFPLCVNETDRDYVYSLYRPLLETQAKEQKEKKNPPALWDIKKFTTPLAEVKDIVNRVSEVLKSGVKPSEVCVLAPYIESYWTCLKSHLKAEGIPVNKSEVTSLYHFPAIQLWMARLRTHLKDLRYENLYTVYAHQNPTVDFNKLKADFYHQRQIDSFPKDSYQAKHVKNLAEFVSGRDFILWAKALLPKVDSVLFKEVDKLLKDFLKSVDKSFVVSTHSPWQAWFSLLETAIKNEEIEIQTADTDGIHCLSFNALAWVSADFVYIAGLSGQNIKTHTLISELSAGAVREDLGFCLQSDPIDKMEKIISWFIHQQKKGGVLSYSTTDFMGQAVSPSRLWLEKAEQKNKKHFDSPGLTHWDRQQQQNSLKDIIYGTELKQIDKTQKEKLSLIQQSIEEDLGEREPSPFCQGEIESLSPSSLESYIKCPFIFTAKKLFKLTDQPEKDIDISALDRGKMIHYLFEQIIKLKKSHTSEILSIIEDIKTQMKNIHLVIWEKEKLYLLNKAQLLIAEEERKKLFFKNYQPFFLEKDFECYWSFKEQKFSRKGDMAFKGKIDRVDRGASSLTYRQTSSSEVSQSTVIPPLVSNPRSGSLAEAKPDVVFYHVIDYKSQLPTGSSAPYWEKQNNFQSAIYAQVVEQGLVDVSPPKEKAILKCALYLSYKNFEYQGLALKEPEYIQLLKSPRKRSLVSEEEKQSLFKKVNKKINHFILNIQKGYFHPQPQSKELCKKCRWRKICRASHLN